MLFPLNPRESPAAAIAFLLEHDLKLDAALYGVTLVEDDAILRAEASLQIFDGWDQAFKSLRNLAAKLSSVANRQLRLAARKRGLVNAAIEAFTLSASQPAQVSVKGFEPSCENLRWAIVKAKR